MLSNNLSSSFSCIFKKDPSSHNSSSRLSDNASVNGRQTRDKTSSSVNMDTVKQHDYLKKYEALSQLPSRVSFQEGGVDANSEKELVCFCSFNRFVWMLLIAFCS